MSGMMTNIRAKVKRRFSHKDAEPDFDDPDASADEETHSYVSKEVETAEKEGDKYPMGRPNSFLNRMISHGNKKTEDEIAGEMRAAEQRNHGAGMGGVGSGTGIGSSTGTGIGSGLGASSGTGQTTNTTQRTVPTSR
ncbi:hypothetical protein LTS08_006521 [Lithohypha guttulata]|uniref:uncharacterized protein n=1 Tax=Lithohypha guttulata TaxID=1690604 RepID=UPI002DE050C9|nr:hypothetical protein LTR51_000706 [Lithohypha guttulata]KAK5098388.1 hypothetical protein LTS08_006521 [Lithohypha guttulata]